MGNPVTLPLLACGFAISGALLGLPSLALLLFYAGHRLNEWVHPAAGDLAIGPNPDALLLMLAGITKAFGWLAQLLDAVFGLVALLAGAGLLLAAALWFTGRGLQAGAGWARYSGGTLLLLALLPSALLALSIPGSGRLLPLLMAVGCVLGLQALWAAPALSA